MKITSDGHRTMCALLFLLTILVIDEQLSVIL